MSKIKASKREVKELERVLELEKKIDSIGPQYVDDMSTEIFKYQPFYLSVLLGYRMDVTPLELDELLRVYFLVWEYFRTSDGPLKKIVTQAQFEKAEDQMVAMLQYSEGVSQNDKGDVFEKDIDTLKSKVLMGVVVSRFQKRSILANMEADK